MFFHYLLKLEPNVDKYVFWSETIRLPILFGEFASIIEWFIYYWGGNREDYADRFERANITGTSCLDGVTYGWHHQIFDVEGGRIPRQLLLDLSVRIRNQQDYADLLISDTAESEQCRTPSS